MKSYKLIIGAVIGMWVLYWTGMIPDSTGPWAFTVSFLVLDRFGAFKREKQEMLDSLRAEAEEIEQQTESRAEEFKRKLREAQENQPDATITIIDPDGNKSSIIIKATGEVITKGDPDPDIVDAAKHLSDAIKVFGPEAIAQELEHFIRAQNDEEIKVKVKEMQDQLRGKDENKD